MDRADPRVIARDLAHKASHAACPANESREIADCRCEPSPDTLAAVWQGRARMAAARRAAGVPLDAYDRQALDRYPHTPGDTP